jgi:hypothetical protein
MSGTAGRAISAINRHDAIALAAAALVAAAFPF